MSRQKTAKYHVKMTQIANSVVEYLDPNLYPSIETKSVILDNFERVQYGRLQIKLRINEREIYVQTKPNIAHQTIDECVLHSFTDLEQEIRHAQKTFR